jgi:hypothetical protein
MVFVSAFFDIVFIPVATTDVAFRTSGVAPGGYWPVKTTCSIFTDAVA